MTKQTKTRICLWASPRNISTAMMYSFAQRSSCTVVDEPLYGYYLSKTAAQDYHPGSIEIINSMNCIGSEVLSWMTNNDFETDEVFFKQMTHHLVDIDWKLILPFKHIILTRNPEQMVLSFSKVIEHPSLIDTGYVQQVKLLSYLIDNQIDPIVVESTRFLKQPKEQLQQICSLLEIEFENNMLSWQAGPRPEDGIWAKHWYQSVHQSTGFAPYKEQNQLLVNDELQNLVDLCQPYYNQLIQYAIKT